MILSETDRFALHYAARLIDEQASALHESGTHPDTGTWTDPSDEETHAELLGTAIDLREIATRHSPYDSPPH